tara:strand:+ start:1915 stop:2382 length:468 start_codon:yes stop_codon:yes gene_type:complete
MRRGAYLLIPLVAGLIVASEAAACTELFLEPASQRIADIRYQRGLQANADAVFLARTRPVFSRRGAVLEPILAIAGDQPPAQAFRPNYTSDCMPPPAPRGVVIAFARRIRVADAGWKFWLWGRWTVFGDVRPSEVVDPELAAALRVAALRARAGG